MCRQIRNRGGHTWNWPQGFRSWINLLFSSSLIQLSFVLRSCGQQRRLQIRPLPVTIARISASVRALTRTECDWLSPY